MYFTLEALQAEDGDALILHFGDRERPRFFLIDGGPTRSGYEAVIRKRLSAIQQKCAPPGKPLTIDMMMVSHIDADHIEGLLCLTDELVAQSATARAIRSAKSSPSGSTASMRRSATATRKFSRGSPPRRPRSRRSLRGRAAPSCRRNCTTSMPTRRPSSPACPRAGSCGKMPNSCGSNPMRRSRGW